MEFQFDPDSLAFEENGDGETLTTGEETTEVMGPNIITVPVLLTSCLKLLSQCVHVVVESCAADWFTCVFSVWSLTFQLPPGYLLS